MGINRKLKRAKLKRDYEKFQRSWNDEQRFQRYLVDHQGGQVTVKDDGSKVILGPNGENLPVLGRKPTFNMWTKMKDEQMAQTAAAKEASTKVQVDDLSWDEGG